MFIAGFKRVASHARRCAFVASLVVASAALYAITTTTADACACGCSVFDIGGGMLPQEDDHGGRVFFEYWGSNQTQNWIGSSKAPASLNTDKNLNTSWYSIGFMYMFNREWGVMVRAPYGTRSFTTDTGPPTGIETFNVRAFADLEVMGIYTGFFKDMSTGIMYGLKLPTGDFRAPGFDRDNQLGTGSTDLLLGGFHRGLLSGDNAWQYFMNAIWRYPFLFQSAPDPVGFIDGNPGVVQTYHPGMQVDGGIGILYNNLYNVLGFDKITPLFQFIMSHRNHDTGTGSDPLNTGFDRVMISPGIEFTKVIDEANKRVLKTYVDVEIPIYYRTNAANNDGTFGQLIAPYLVKAVVSYNF
jgi:hypothetical protein